MEYLKALVMMLLLCSCLNILQVQPYFVGGNIIMNTLLHLLYMHNPAIVEGSIVIKNTFQVHVEHV